MVHIRLSALLGRRRWRLAVLAALNVTIAATYLLGAVALASVFGRLVSGASTFQSISGPLAVLAVMLIVRPVVVWVREVAAATLLNATKMELRSRLAHAQLRRAARDAGRGPTGADHALVVDGVEHLDPYLGKYLPTLISVGVTFVAVSAALLFMDPVAALPVVVMGLVLPSLPRWWDKALAARGADHWDAYQGVHADFLDSTMGMTTLIHHGGVVRRHHRIRRRANDLLDATMNQMKLSLLESGLNSFALVAVPVVALVALWFRHDSLTGVELFAFTLLSIEMVRPLRELSGAWHAGFTGTFSGARIQQILAEEAQQGTELRLRHDGKDAVVVESVTFTYPNASSPVLRDVTLHFGVGLTALVGPTGTGKSTVAYLLSGLYTPESGTVVVPPSPNPDHGQFGAVSLAPQNPLVFSGTVRSNLGLVSEDADDIDWAAGLVGIGTDDASLTLDTEVGERGALISGGQRQRIAIARCLLQHRPVLVLDEATSALDVRSEQAILDRIRAARAGLVTIVIAHRQEVTHMCDQVVDLLVPQEKVGATS